MSQISIRRHMASGKRVGFMFIGRTNPPTKAHIDIILQMVRLRNEVDESIPIILNLSPSSPIKIKQSGDFEDPLRCHEKIALIASMIGKLGLEFEKDRIYPLCSEEKITGDFRTYQISKFIREAGIDLEILYVFIGQDRFEGKDPIKQYSSIVNYNEDESGKMVAKKFGIEMVVMPRDPSSPSNMSASKIRKIIADNNLERAIPLLREAYTYSSEYGDVELLDERELVSVFHMVTEGMEIGLEAKLSSKPAKKSRKGLGKRRTRTRGSRHRPQSHRRKRGGTVKRVRFNL